jgi:hypothetical protein
LDPKTAPGLADQGKRQPVGVPGGRQGRQAFGLQPAGERELVLGQLAHRRPAGQHGRAPGVERRLQRGQGRQFVVGAGQDEVDALLAAQVGQEAREGLAVGQRGRVAERGGQVPGDVVLVDVGQHDAQLRQPSQRLDQGQPLAATAGQHQHRAHHAARASRQIALDSSG